MPRRFLIFFAVLMFLLQGVTQVSADPLAAAQMQEHCAGHENPPEDCPCCPDDLMLNGGCASLCSIAPALPPATVHIPPDASREPPQLVVLELSGPAYLPLIPPPIS